MTPIVYLEDNPDMRELVSELLSTLDEPVHVAGDAQGARRVLQAVSRPFVLVTDWFVADLVAETLLEELAPELQAKQLQVVVTSGWSGDFSALRARGIRIVKKPFGTEELLGAVAEGLRALGGAPP